MLCHDLARAVCTSADAAGIILIVSGLIGIVFFTFAASWTYFSLYADLERDEAQYRMIGKMGLSRLLYWNIAFKFL